MEDLSFFDELSKEVKQLYKIVTDTSYAKDVNENKKRIERHSDLKKGKGSRLVYYQDKAQLYLGFKKYEHAGTIHFNIFALNKNNDLAFAIRCSTGDQPKMAVINQIEAYLIQQFQDYNHVYFDEIEKIISKNSNNLIYENHVKENGKLFYNMRAFVIYEKNTYEKIQLMVPFDSYSSTYDCRPIFKSNGSAGCRYSFYLYLRTDSNKLLTTEFTILIPERFPNEPEKDGYHILSNKRQEIEQFCVDRLQASNENKTILDLNTLITDVQNIILKDHLHTYEIVETATYLGAV